ncbi:MAG TPA: phosphonate metabolism protein/1,5-bisphosphokinase (PRPP-forming) PhnN, partial [Roseovarius nubinhibens]|nr:phosphonate metabolism protein/1,5-bisphosphokinase (PRPP-forming) PhnN [Roseovarius nubinhibens]
MKPKGVATARGTLFVIVGPSGVGKDTLIDGARAALGQSHWFRFVRRVITRPADSGGEEHIAISEADFDAALAEGRFFHHWRAHGLGYGVPADVAEDLAAGVNVVLNGSRAEVAALREKYRRTVTIQVTASRTAVEARLRARGREDEAQIAKRLDRLSATGLVEGALELRNEGPVADGVAALVDLIAGSCDLCATAQGLDMDFAMGAVCLAHRDNPVAARLLAGSTRVAVSFEGAEVVADLGWTSDSNLVGRDALALSSAAMEKLGVANGDCLRIARSPTPQSREVLQRKIRGGTLSAPEITGFVDDLV